MYFSREVANAPNTSDIYFTARPSTTLPFADPVPVVNVNSPEREGRPFLTPDELTLVLSSNRSGQLDILINARPSVTSVTPFGTPDSRNTMAVNAFGTEHADPSLSADGLRLFLTANTGPLGQLQLLIATRANVTSNFSTPTQIPGTVDNTHEQGDPTLYQDERLLVFSSFPVVGGDANLWYATRPTAADSFGPPTQIPGVNTDAIDFDPVLSGDGCEVYFASNRGGAGLHLFHAQVSR
jgi:Tol biopolymer transport system component